MQYDFDSILDRSGTHAIAIDAIGTPEGFGFAPEAPKEGWDVIPMWVADMNFPGPQSVVDAVVERAKHPAFGYFSPSDEYCDAIIRWHAARKGVTSGLEKEHIGYENGVLGGVASAITAFSAPGDKILLHSPTYIGFQGTVNNLGRKMVLSDLVRDEAGVWRMDFDDMERKLRDQNIHLAIFCSPFNPCGRVWEQWEIERAMVLYQKYECVVINDEIWSDLILEQDRPFVTTQSVSEWARQNVLSFYAPSKTFNLAGLIGSYHVVYNKRLRDRLNSVADSTHYNNMNCLSERALIGAYSDEGSSWLDQLLPVLRGNRDYACDYIEQHFGGVSVFRPEGTYMLFLDCAGWLQEHGKTQHELLKAGWDVGVAWQDGAMFNGPTHIRMNLALPLGRVQEAFRRLDEQVFNA